MPVFIVHTDGIYWHLPEESGIWAHFGVSNTISIKQRAYLHMYLPVTDKKFTYSTRLDTFVMNHHKCDLNKPFIRIFDKALYILEIAIKYEINNTSEPSIKMN